MHSQVQVQVHGEVQVYYQVQIQGQIYITEVLRCTSLASVKFLSLRYAQIMATCIPASTKLLVLTTLLQYQ